MLRPHQVSAARMFPGKNIVVADKKRQPVIKTINVIIDSSGFLLYHLFPGDFVRITIKPDQHLPIAGRQSKAQSSRAQVHTRTIKIQKIDLMCALPHVPMKMSTAIEEMEKCEQLSILPLYKKSSESRTRVRYNY